MSKPSKIKIERGNSLPLYNAAAHMASHPHPRWLDMTKNLQEFERFGKENNDLLNKITLQKPSESDQDYRQRVDKQTEEFYQDKVELSLYTFTQAEFQNTPLVAAKIMPAIDVILK